MIFLWKSTSDPYLNMQPALFLIPPGPYQAIFPQHRGLSSDVIHHIWSCHSLVNDINLGDPNPSHSCDFPVLSFNEKEVVGPDVSWWLGCFSLSGWWDLGIVSDYGLHCWMMGLRVDRHHGTFFIWKKKNFLPTKLVLLPFMYLLQAKHSEAANMHSGGILRSIGQFFLGNTLK